MTSKPSLAAGTPDGLSPDLKAAIDQYLRNLLESGAALGPRYMSVNGWCASRGTSRRVTYDLLGQGHLKAVKLGNKTLIDVPHGDAYLRSLPPADIKPPPRRRHAAAEQHAT